MLKQLRLASGDHGQVPHDIRHGIRMTSMAASPRCTHCHSAGPGLTPSSGPSPGRPPRPSLDMLCPSSALSTAAPNTRPQPLPRPAQPQLASRSSPVPASVVPSSGRSDGTLPRLLRALQWPDSQAPWLWEGGRDDSYRGTHILGEMQLHLHLRGDALLGSCWNE